MDFETLEAAVQHAYADASSETTCAFLAGAMTAAMMVIDAGTQANERGESQLKAIQVRIGELVQEAGELASIIVNDAEGKRKAARAAIEVAEVLKDLKGESGAAAALTRVRALAAAKTLKANGWTDDVIRRVVRGLDLRDGEGLR